MSEVPSIDVLDAAGATRTVATATALATLQGAVTETAPATDTASSGLNGRLQRIAQRVTSLIGLLPTALGSAAASASLAVTQSTEDIARVGIVTETAPATDTASSGLNGRLQRIAQRLSTLISGGLAVTGTFWQATQPVSIATAPALVAGTALIGKVGIDQTTPGTTNGVRDDKGNRIITAVGSTLTRPANTTAYTANDAISNNATAGSVTDQTVTVSDTNDYPVGIAAVELHSTDTGVAGASIRMFVYNSDPTASSGVVGGDNAAFSNKKAGFVGTLSGVMRAFSDGSRGVLVPDEASPLMTLPKSGAMTLSWQLQTLSAFTPSANSTTFIPTFHGVQGVP